jgi:5'-3' exonuclease
MSNDSDFYQLLLQPNIFLARTAGLYGRAQFEKEFIQMHPDEWPRIMALKGSHNGVPGIKGVGGKTALKIVMNGITDEEIEKRYKHSPEEIKLRTALARFPFPLAPRPVLPKTRPIIYDALKFEEVCIKYGIRFKTEFHNAFLRLAK